MKKVTIEIDEAGNVVIATAGFSGGECLKETADIERSLGVTTSDEKTPEFHKTLGAKQTVSAKA